MNSSVMHLARQLSNYSTSSEVTWLYG
uniref:Uncharacterized protein n=1 Tax=Anguilla anguilla TaxID=7936 RepID=A0A0E9WBW9_ANGAN